MKYIDTISRTTLAVALALGLSLGCSDEPTQQHAHTMSCADELRADAYVAGLEKLGAAVKVQLTSVPAPPTKGDNTWTLMVTDLQDRPIDGLSIDSTPFMPDHGHGTPLQETMTPGEVPGEYVLAPINLWMPGYWEVAIDLFGTDVEDEVVYKVCIEG